MIYIGFIFLLISLKAILVQELIKKRPQSEFDAYLLVVKKFGLNLTLPNNVTWFEQENGNDNKEYHKIKNL